MLYEKLHNKNNMILSTPFSFVQYNNETKMFKIKKFNLYKSTLIKNDYRKVC